MDHMLELGTVAFVQVMPRSVKQPGLRYERYDPAPLQRVSQLLIEPGGVLGLDDHGRRVLDLHHAAHPQSRSRGTNGVSIGFTSHYAALRDHFGPHLVDGCGGENIVIRSDRRFTLDDLGAYVLIHHAADGKWCVLRQPSVAEPCAPFARFAIGAGDLDVQHALHLLRFGARGFYLGPLPIPPSPPIAPGDRVYASHSLPSSIIASAES
jgi:hypothetical protein